MHSEQDHYEFLLHEVVGGGPPPSDPPFVLGLPRNKFIEPADTTLRPLNMACCGITFCFNEDAFATHLLLQAKVGRVDSIVCKVLDFDVVPEQDGFDLIKATRVFARHTLSLIPTAGDT